MNLSNIAASIEELAQLDVKFLCEHSGPAGKVAVALSKDQVLQYVKDPVGFLAEHYGVSKQDYLEWHRSGYIVRCAGITGKGKRCMAVIAGGSGLEPAQWAAMKGGKCRAH